MRRAYAKTVEQKNAQIKKAQEEAARKARKRRQRRRRRRKRQKKKAASTSGSSSTSSKGPTSSTGTSSSSGPKTTTKSSGGTAEGRAIADYGLTFVGNPYVYGGTSLTNGTDCSGFTQGVYAHFGYSIPRNSAAQRSAGREVAYEDAEPGDLICYAGHVAIYIGNGQIVHASTPTTGIKVSPAGLPDHFDREKDYFVGTLVEGRLWSGQMAGQFLSISGKEKVLAAI